jgi:hypothetical protein
MTKILIESVKKFGSIKVNIIYSAKFIKDERETELSIGVPGSSAQVISMTDSIPEFLNENYNQNREVIDDMPLAESGSTFLKFSGVRLVLTRNAAMVGSQYIDLPKWIKDKKAVLNIQNKDVYCFAWSVIASIHHFDNKSHPERVKNYESFLNELKLSNLEFPMKISNIPKFEEMNNISINVFGFSNENGKESVYPLYNSKFEFKKVIDLLYIESENLNENNKKSTHYALIRDFNRLAKSSCVSYKTSSTKSANIICKKCITLFNSTDAYEKHLTFCKVGHSQCIMPNETGKIVKFKNFGHKYRHPITIYADIETLLKPVNEKLNDSETKISYHDAIMVGMHTVYSDGNSEYNSFFGKDCLTDFFTKIRMTAVDFMETKTKLYPNYCLTENDKQMLKNATKCWLCNDSFSDKVEKSKTGKDYQPYKKVTDHCHVSGKILGAAHLKCNAGWHIKETIPIVMHNLSRYDSHLIIKSINQLNGENPTIIPKTEEEYISFSTKIPYGNENRKVELRFIDSLRFMQASLDELSSNLMKAGKQNLKNLLKHVENETIFWIEENEIETTETIIDKDWNVKFNKVKKVQQKNRIKGIFPYEFVDSFDKLNYKNILTKKDFYDNLNQKSITDQEYSQFLKVWNSIPDVDIQKYMELYLKIDVLALADVFESFRDAILESHKLDPIYYYTAPGLSYDAMLLSTKVELELLTDYDMLLMIEKGMRGGVSGVVGDRYVDVEKKNFMTNKDIKPDDLHQEWLLYVDANNLYGHSMSQKLPIGEFKWLDQKQISILDYAIRNDKLTGNEDIGYIIDVDLIVPKTEEFKNFPLAPESKTVKYEKLSNYSKSLNEKMFETSKLILDFQDKKNYIVHMKNLVYYFRKGSNFKINRVIQFKQSAWLQSYIDLNTKLRQEARNEFEKDFFKLLNNSVFGKLMENVRQRVDIKLATTWEYARKYIKKPTYSHLKVFNENLVAIHMRRYETKFNKPIYAGFAVLELSKHLMYTTYYDRIKKMFKEVGLIYTDTDSMVLHIKNSGNIYKIMAENENNDLFDLSDYPVEHILHSDKNKKVIGKLKDELSGNVMNRFISLRSKMYSYQKFDGEFKRCKGIKRCVVKNEIKFDDYYGCLFGNKKTQHTFQTFKSINHELFTISSTKKGLSAFDTKRYYIDNVQSVPFM